jgi:hypothetical protein
MEEFEKDVIGRIEEILIEEDVDEDVVEDVVEKQKSWLEDGHSGSFWDIPEVIEAHRNGGLTVDKAAELTVEDLKRHSEEYELDL